MTDDLKTTFLIEKISVLFLIFSKKFKAWVRAFITKFMALINSYFHFNRIKKLILLWLTLIWETTFNNCLAIEFIQFLCAHHFFATIFQKSQIFKSEKTQFSPKFCWLLQRILKHKILKRPTGRKYWYMKILITEHFSKTWAECYF